MQCFDSVYCCYFCPTNCSKKPECVNSHCILIFLLFTSSTYRMEHTHLRSFLHAILLVGLVSPLYEGRYLQPSGGGHEFPENWRPVRTPRVSHEDLFTQPQHMVFRRRKEVSKRGPEIYIPYMNASSYN